MIAPQYQGLPVRSKVAATPPLLHCPFGVSLACRGV